MFLSNKKYFSLGTMNNYILAKYKNKYYSAEILNFIDDKNVKIKFSKSKYTTIIPIDNIIQNNFSIN